MMRHALFGAGILRALMADAMMAGAASDADIAPAGKSYPLAPDQPKPRVKGDDGPRPAHTYRGHRRNAYFGRASTGNTRGGL